MDVKENEKRNVYFDENSVNPLARFLLSSFNTYLYLPALWLRQIIVGLQQRPVYYHRKYKRVKDIDLCETHDFLCMFEANNQYYRDKLVESTILSILKKRRDQCIFFYGADSISYCQKSIKDFDDASLNYFVKYSDLGMKGNAQDAYMKQKHRMIWERRNGKSLVDGAPIVTPS